MSSEPNARQLPGHIAQLLARQHRSADGRPADSAGIPWDGRDLSAEGNPLHTRPTDDGHTAPVVAAARKKLLAGEIDEASFVNVLRGQRLFAAVLATGSGDIATGDKEADISLITLEAGDGRTAMPVFTSVEALTAWHPQGRPVAAETERVMLAALAEGAELAVLDPGAELTFVLRRPAVEQLAQGEPWLPSYADEQLAAALEEIVAACPGVTGLRLSPALGIATATATGQRVLGGGQGPELSIGVVTAEGLDAVDRRLALASVKTEAAASEALRRRADSVEIVLAES
ncbi:SseB family protein [Nesterenkonia alba]|uniref:SseB family protein n=1 Tax=Nesterenkonia alba TaxID=515814 RepID=UPI0003B72F03|nr:SseB family protein [Nesterenkonia alba]